MLKIRALFAVLPIALIVAGCHKPKPKPPTPPPPPAVLGVDLYLHPESGTGDDLILQTAIRGALEAQIPTARLQVRVAALKVVISGSVATQALKDQVQQTASAVAVTIGQRPPSTTTAARTIAAASVNCDLVRIGNP